VNLAAIEQYGYSQDEFLRMTTLDIHPPEDIPALRAMLAKQGASVRKSKWVHRKKDGSLIDVEVVSHDLDWSGRAARLVLATDISERLQAERNLRQRELDLAEAQRIAHMGSFEMELSTLHDIENNRLHWSDENFRVFGYEPGQIEVTGAIFLDSVHPEDKSRIREEIIRSIREEGSTSLDYRIVRPDGGIRFIHSQSKVICEESTRRPTRLIGVAQDVTEKKKAEERFYKAFNANPEPMTIATFAEGRFLDVNESFLRVTGHSRGDVIGHTSMEIKFWKSPEERTRFIERLEKQARARNLEIKFLTKSGQERTAYDSADVVEMDGQKCILAIFKDITEQ
jgi:PAS domain S-box-containing protein